MKNKELYDKTVGILVDAYFNDTLEYIDVCAYGVGNLVAAAVGCKIKKEGYFFKWFKYGQNIYPYWCNVFAAGDWIDQNNALGLEQINSTGYNAQELFGLERAFSNSLDLSIKNSFNRNFKALMGIVDYLDIIHENTDQLTTEQSKARFVCTTP